MVLVHKNQHFLFFDYITVVYMKSKSMRYNRTMAYMVQYNWLTFVNNPYFRQSGGILCLKEFSFYEVATSASTEKYAIRHGEYVSPTQMKNRRIRFLFDIIADTEEERRALLGTVQRAFAPEANPTPFNENLWKDLSFMDIDGNIRKCRCQIYKWIELSDFANQKWVWISAELITDSSYMRSEQEYTQTITNTLPWIKLPSNLWFPRVYYRNINFNGSIETPVTMEITINNADMSLYPYNKIKIVHDSDYYWKHAMYIDNISSLGLSVGDVITVDTDKRRCYYTNSDGTEDITWLVELGSNRPVLVNGDNQIWIDVGVREHVITAIVKRNKVF